jgi:hypothetical protein
MTAIAEVLGHLHNSTGSERAAALPQQPAPGVH